jgi:hypothetical protein
MTQRRFEAFLLMNDKEAKAWMSKLDPDDLASLEIMMDRAREAQDATPAPAKAKAPAPDPARGASMPISAAPKLPERKLGLGKDGIYRVTDAQMRNPEWCYATQAERSKAKGQETVI